MEANQHGDSKSSSEETDRSEQGNDDLGTGRSYECVFCKRGFTTAQALGGHMNIHRKDRAKSRPSLVPSVTSKVDDNYASLGSYHQPIQSYFPHYSTSPHEVHVNYQTFLPASTWVMRPPHVHNSDVSYVHNPHHLNPFEEDWRENLSLQLGPSHIDDGKEKRQGGNIEEDDLDLELRLGHDP